MPFALVKGSFVDLVKRGDVPGFFRFHRFSDCGMHSGCFLLGYFDGYKFVGIMPGSVYFALPLDEKFSSSGRYLGYPKPGCSPRWTWPVFGYIVSRYRIANADLILLSK